MSAEDALANQKLRLFYEEKFFREQSVTGKKWLRIAGTVHSDLSGERKEGGLLCTRS